MKKTILATICAAALAPLAALADADAPVAMLVTEEALAEYASISNGTVVIGENSITPVTGDTIGEHVSLSNNVLTVGGVSTSIQSQPEPRRIAMFVIPVNAETSGTFAGIELKASTNNFSHAVEEDVRLQYYAQGEIADTGEVGTNRWDRMKLFVCTAHAGDDARAYHAISNTLAWTHQLTSVVALVDADCLVRHPDGDWLRDDNDELSWCYLRTRNNSPAFEQESGTSRGLWRPVAPARWFRELPSWAR